VDFKQGLNSLEVYLCFRQEREELQREGDALDAKIRKAEHEVTALETTMLQLVAANGNYGAMFKKVDSSASVAERAALR
jgi:cell division protein FtsB